MVKYEPSTHSHLFYSVALYVFSYFIDVSISSHCTVAAAHRRATEAVAGFSFGVGVGGGQASRGPKVLPIQNRKLGGFGPLFFFKRTRIIKNRAQTELWMVLFKPKMGPSGVARAV